MIFEKQEHQEECVKNILNILECTKFKEKNFFEQDWKEAFQKHYKKKEYKNLKINNKKKIDILMETGTGKTFTYLQTIFEINKHFGKNHFIIVVPRNAIKLGIKQNIQLTAEYFHIKYKKYFTIIDYPNHAESKINFDFLSNSNTLAVLILTNSSFNKKRNILNRENEKSLVEGSRVIWKAIADKKPVVIMDEPHLLQGGKTQESLEQLDRSLFIRFGATYPKQEASELSNVAYILDSISAFRKYLVKKVRVHNFAYEGENKSFRLLSSDSTNKNFMLSYFQNGESKKKIIYLNQDIESLTKISHFQGVSATRITKKEVFLSNGESLKIKSDYKLSEEEIEYMVKSTIKKHFEREVELFSDGFKVLSLFFIPNIQDFRGENPKIKKIFEEQYSAIRKEYYQKTTNENYKKYLEKDFNEKGNLIVHEGYFAGDKGSKDEKEESGVNIILKDKKKLLSFEKNLRFIFSVWALQEGWDNPNIFQICKLANSSQETSKRQQVGRGLRLAVNQTGVRYTYQKCEEQEDNFFSINTLDVFVSNQETNFIESIQKEIQESSFSIAGNKLSTELLVSIGMSQINAAEFIICLQKNNIILENEEKQIIIQSPIADFMKNNKELFFFLGKDFDSFIKKFVDNRNMIENADKPPKKVKIREEFWEEFQELWEIINKKSKITYHEIDENCIIQKVKEKLAKEEIEPINLILETKIYNTQTDSIEVEEHKKLGQAKFFQKEKNFESIIESFQNDEVLKLPLAFIIKLLNAIDLQKIQNDPKRAIYFIKESIKDALFDSLEQKIEYQLENEVKITSLQDKNRKFLSEIEYNKLGRYYTKEEVPDNLLYDTIVFDSDIEKRIQQKDPLAINEDQIVVFAKLPKISIPTPFKSYNPDFAYVIKKKNGLKKKLFLIVESKGYDFESQIPKIEQRKIAYAEKFFEKLQQTLPDIQIVYKKRINKQELLSLIQDIKET